MVTNFQKPAKKESKKDLPSKASTSKKKSKDDEDGKKKKDPNAPKREMSGFMFFSKLERDVCSIICHIGYMVLDLGVEVVGGSIYQLSPYFRIVSQPQSLG